jgi:hypothetical protein
MKKREILSNKDARALLNKQGHKSKQKAEAERRQKEEKMATELKPMFTGEIEMIKYEIQEDGMKIQSGAVHPDIYQKVLKMYKSFVNLS